MHLFELTRRLITIPSISGNEEDIADFLREYLARAGFDVEFQHVSDGRPNLYAHAGHPDIVLSTHTDTVPPYVELNEDDDFIYGRGACDAKGIIAAMVKAAESLLSKRVSNFGLLFLVGEEAGSPGARAANRIPNQSRYLINGEPTESKLAVGSKGALRVILTMTGKAAHSAYPQMGESAIDKLIDVVSELRAAPLPEHPVLGHTTMNVGRITGGVAANVIAPSAEAELMFRVVSNIDSLKSIVQQTVGGRAAVEYTFACNPVFTEQLDGFDTTVVSFTTDIPLLENWGKPLLFGPGSILDAHTLHEKISKKELAGAVDIYAELVQRLKKTSSQGAVS